MGRVETAAGVQFVGDVLKVALVKISNVQDGGGHQFNACVSYARRRIHMPAASTALCI